MQKFCYKKLQDFCSCRTIVSNFLNILLEIVLWRKQRNLSSRFCSTWRNPPMFAILAGGDAGYHGSRTGLFIGRGSLDCEGMSYQRLNMHTIERPALGWPRTDLLRAKANKLINKTRAALFAARLLWVYFWFILNVSSLLFACRANRRIRTSQFDVPTRVRRMWVLSRSERENHISAGH